jgi:uncharacterized membrane protein
MTRTATSKSPALTSRIVSLDLVRGAVMVVMAIDHVRVYSGLPPGGPTFGIFFTRWITHFAAPAFVFLAGTSAYLYGSKLPERSALSKFLLTRGVWLVLLELTVLRVAWTFNFDFADYLLAGVIWMIGWCMIIMAALVRVPIAVNAIGGVAIIALHNITDLFQGPLEHVFASSEPNWFLKILYFGGMVKIGSSGPPLFILYVIVPWIGVMMAGYAFGKVMELPSERRRTICLRLGAALSVLFLVLRAVNLYGDPRPWKGTALSFLNTTKYPASLSFLLMTLGPMLVVLAFAEGRRGRLAEIVTTFGRVPMFYYLLHIPLIHFAACLVSMARQGQVNPWLFANHPVAAGPAPPGYPWSLGLLYAVFAVCVTVLYFPCRWYAELRARRKSNWLSYL